MSPILNHGWAISKSNRERDTASYHRDYDIKIDKIWWSHYYFSMQEKKKWIRPKCLFFVLFYVRAEEIAFIYNPIHYCHSTRTLTLLIHGLVNLSLPTLVIKILMFVCIWRHIEQKIVETEETIEIRNNNNNSCSICILSHVVIFPHSLFIFKILPRKSTRHLFTTEIHHTFMLF